MRRVHAFLAFVFALPLILLSLSGALLGFARETDRILHVDLVSAHFSSLPVLATDELAQRAQAAFPDLQLVDVLPAKTLYDSTLFIMTDVAQRRHEVYVHSQTGEILGSRLESDNFYHRMRHIHTQLLLGETGRWIAFAAALGLLLTTFSGLALRRQSYAQNINARTHPLLGVVTSPVLLAISITALMMIPLPEASWLHTLHTGEMFAMPGRVLWVLASLAVPLLMPGGIASYRARKNHLKNPRHA